MPAIALAVEPAVDGRRADISPAAAQETGTLAGPVRRCGNTRHGKDIRIVSYQYVNCATAQEVAARFIAGQALPSIAPGAAVRWRCNRGGWPNASSEFGSELPAGYVECVGYRGGEFIRFKPVGAPPTGDGPPAGVSVWGGGGRWEYIQRRGNRLRIAWLGGSQFGYEQGKIRGDKARLRTDYGVQTTQYRRSGNTMRQRVKFNGSWSEWYSARRNSAKKTKLKRLFGRADWSNY